MNGQTLAVSDSWLDQTTALTTTNSMQVGSITGLGQYQCYPSTVQYPTYYYWATPAPRPIKLSMAEVERLRKAARADKKLKSVLAKFTSQIEVVVDFE